MRVRNVKRDTQPDYKSPTRTNYNSENVIDENGTGKKKKKKNRLKFNKKMYLVLSLDRSKSFGWRTVFGSMSRTHHLLKTFKQPDREKKKKQTCLYIVQAVAHGTLKKIMANAFAR